MGQAEKNSTVKQYSFPAGAAHMPKEKKKRNKKKLEVVVFLFIIM